MANLVRVEKRIMTDCVEENHNKFWTGELYDNGMVITRWGRVGDSGQSKEFPGAGASFLEKKLREKEGKGYRVIDAVGKNTPPTSGKTVVTSQLSDIARKQIKSNNPLVTSLIDRLVKANAHSIMVNTGGKIVYNDTTGLFTTATGDVVSQATIDAASAILEEIGDMVAAQNYGIELGRKTNDYLMKIPSDIGHRKLDIREWWRDLSKVQAQKQILDSLQASLVSATSAPSAPVVAGAKAAPEQQIFDCQLHLIEDGKEIDRIRNLYHKTRKAMHQCYHLDVKTVYSVEINTVNAAFEKDGAKMSNIWELYHGTRVSNLLSIMRAGLIIPPPSSPHVCGRAFGDGLYFSDQSTKSLNYAYGAWDNKSKDNNCFMFLCSVAMGKYYEPHSTFSGKARPGYDSTFAKGGGVFQNNEMIVYRCSQCKLNRLIEFSPGGK